ncbi:hypothetical protein PFICI_12429 [Pestalotiopsis fici W106-1]|uniref:Uncharacterized protein n=1 Tax=Pestalotiopsis fici (strain W106-1 / CGMCC3.15140) TaxID=1229662 RepID=W3WNJ5_PESFW|nr:uncharacterized protein PFICI_12429 [Pestalotiopsis fici W106-1]ETS75485.1 hypothetical protein PFICI_12429 [Pestalotiopsis fici W106-1]
MPEFSTKQDGVTSTGSIHNGYSEPAIDSSGRQLVGHTQQPVAVVGMACRLPGHSNSPKALWDFLLKGGVAVNEPPSSRFSLAGHYDKSMKPRTMKSPGGMFMEDVDPAHFDGQFFNISRTDCIAMDPQQRQLLEVTYECLENSGVTLEELSGTRTGVIVGSNFIDYGAIQNRDPENRAESITIGLASSILSNRISHFLNVHGPSMTLDTACSASLVAVDVACRYLDSFQADGMLVEGTNMWLSPEHNQEIGMMHMTQSGTGKCHSFDAKADGYVKAEGINAVYLKRLDDAIRDGDPIRAVIRGTAASASGRTAGIANPSPKAQAFAIREAYKNAGIRDFQETSFLECHGTGTLAGDPVEVKGAASVFSDGRSDGQDLVIGSIKSNIGHSEAAAGISGLIKAVMAVETGIIPGTPTFVTPNPAIDWKASRVQASRTSMKWPTAGIRRASVNSFGFGGANAHVVLEQAPFSHHVSSYKQVSTDFFDDSDDETSDTARQKTSADKLTPPTLLVFSSNDKASLENYVASISAHLINPTVSINTDDLAYTLSEHRSKHYYRGFSVVRSAKAKIDKSTLVIGKQASSAPRVGFVFTGQGAQWSQMGSDLLKQSSLAHKVIQDLDDVLQSLPEPPSWSLLKELSEPRSIEVLRQPEFSQPLVTALQLALVEVLKSWGITSKAVIGHSSGEIAAAAAAGLITSETAIRTAYFRGKAAKMVPSPDEPVGMLAVGVGPEILQPYFESVQGRIQIACYNSPSSLTISGTTATLQDLCTRLKEDGHFARMLQVDLAYHSDYMSEIGDVYERLLSSKHATDGHMNGNQALSVTTRMFSSVTGNVLPKDALLGAAYWKSNMVSPVQFAQATRALLADSEHGADFLIEIGPSSTLAGPIGQIQKEFTTGPANESTYASTLKRGQDATFPMYNMAGQLFIKGGAVDLCEVNRYCGPVFKMRPKVLVDLPNYSWNHSISYWHETQASKDWRFRKFVTHDLLGSKILGTPWQAPVFNKVLKLTDLPWLSDHKLGSQVVFPGAAYMTMAIEAMYQTAMMTKWRQEPPAEFRYRLRDVKFLRALVLDENAESRITLTLFPRHGGSIRSWFEFKVCSFNESLSTEHCVGQICVETEYQVAKSLGEAKNPLDLPVPAGIWYKALARAGYNFGPLFQKQLNVEIAMGQRKGRSMVNLQPPLAIAHTESHYPMHPTVMDGCLQTGSPPLWKGDSSAVMKVLVPKTIDSLVLMGSHELPREGITFSSATFLGVGNVEDARNYATNVSLYDPCDGRFIFEMKGLASAEIDTSDAASLDHTFTRVSWNADISLLMKADNSLVRKWFADSNTIKTVQDLLNLVAHKNPGLKVLEINMSPGDSSSWWIDPESKTHAIRAASSDYSLVVSEAKTLISAQQELSPRSAAARFHLLDTSQQGLIAESVQFDLGIIKSSSTTVSESTNALVLNMMRKSMSETGFILTSGLSQEAISGFGRTVAVPQLGADIYLSQIRPEGNETANLREKHPNITHISFLEPETKHAHSICEVLEAIGSGRWMVKTAADPLRDIDSSGEVVVILDELFEPILPHLDERMWRILKHVTQKRCQVLWVTSGAHINVTDPTKASATGLLRSIRAEEGLCLMTLDLECTSDVQRMATTIESCLEQLCTAEVGDDDPAAVDYEYVERDGIISISRLVPDLELTALQSDDTSARQTEVMGLHGCDTLVRLQCERLGDLDAICFAEAAPQPIPLREGFIEIQIHAAGLNYKDVVVSMGIVPGDDSALGYEAAGVVTKISPTAARTNPDLAIGQRVVAFSQGALANKLQTTPGRVHRIPDSMSFETAATLTVVYLTSLHALSIAKLTAGKRILIHSAAGGVGMAALQLAVNAGAKVFATVGTEEKREFLKSTFSLTDDSIFYSRNVDFADQILSATDGKGVDIVLNSLTGDLLVESFRILADGGVMVEIGKKDILDRSSLPMAVFDRNTTFRGVDMSPERVSDDLASQLFSELFDLLDNGRIQPVHPIHQFSWGDIPSAIRFLRSGKHMGKIVITDGEAEVQVPIRRAPKTFPFDDNRCYLIVGGLRGLCGSLAIYLAKMGAKYLAVIARSGHKDKKSQAIVKQVNALGAHIDLLTADVTVAADVDRVLTETRKPVGGIIQGAMVLRDRPFDSMSVTEYHEAVTCKVQGTWNLHVAAEKLGFNLSFFTMLSSISGVVGNRGQANYSAANVFLDAFAEFRLQRGQAACSVDLGVIEDAGFIAERGGFQDKHFDNRMFNGIDDRLLRKILYFSILQQRGQVGCEKSPCARGSRVSLGQMITGLVMPQPADSWLRKDARFAALFTGQGSTTAMSGGNNNNKGDADVQALLLMLRTASSNPAATLTATIKVINQCFMRILRLSEPLDPARPLSIYGIDSLSAVEVRNWVRSELGILVTTLDIMNASSLEAFCNKIVMKMAASES